MTMRTAVRETSIDAYHAHRGAGIASAQQQRILQFITQHGGDWSIGELANALGMEKSTVSGRVFELLNQTHDLIEFPKRRDRMSGITVRPVGIRPMQGSLFQ